MDEPKLHLWETGVMRITRHPQSFGQALWCFAHTLWIGARPPPAAACICSALLPGAWRIPAARRQHRDWEF